MPTRSSTTPSSVKEPRWLTALVQGLERYQECPDPAVWTPLIERREHAINMFQEFADYFLAATAEVAKPLKTYRPEHAFGIRIRHLRTEIHGWVDVPNPVRPDSAPRLRIEVGNRFNPSDALIILWQTTVSDNHTIIDFAPAVAAWTHWLNQQPPPPTLAEQREHRDNIIGTLLILALFVLLAIFR